MISFFWENRKKEGYLGQKFQLNSTSPTKISWRPIRSESSSESTFLSTIQIYSNSKVFGQKSILFSTLKDKISWNLKNGKVLTWTRSKQKNLRWGIYLNNYLNPKDNTPQWFPRKGKIWYS